MNVIRWFEQLRLTDRPSVGGKCASLGELIAAGIDVPPGFAVTVDAFEALRDTGGLRERLRAIGHDVDPGDAAALDSAHRAATRLVRAATIADDVAEQVRTAYAELSRREVRPDLPVAVRSSAVAEDGDAASFAGQQDTYLWTVGADDVLARLRDCWASLYTPQAIAYRARLPHDTAAAATRISVGVQAMVDAEVAGVVFTVSPRSGDRSVVAINSSWGLGQAVVSGEVTPDEFWLSKAELRITARTVADKTRECRPAPGGRGVVTVDVPMERRRGPSLDDDRIRSLAALAIRVEEHYGCPQDIEWALSRATDERPARLLVLQSRPETTWRDQQARSRLRQAPPSSYLGVIHAAGLRPTKG